ncbi:MAG: hypothetical protein Kow00122_18420 [Thermoleophilia bacterium]
MRSEVFFDTHPVFTLERSRAARAHGGATLGTSKNLLARYVASGRLVRVRRGVYATVPRGAPANNVTVDPHLPAPHPAAGAVIAYHAALQFSGKAHNLWNRFHYLTCGRWRPLTVEGATSRRFAATLPASHGTCTRLALQRDSCAHGISWRPSTCSSVGGIITIHWREVTRRAS